jgi:hypothetical protein
MFSQVLTHWTMDIATSRTLLRGLQDDRGRYDFTALADAEDKWRGGGTGSLTRGW